MKSSLQSHAHNAIQNSIRSQEPVFIEPQTDADFDEIRDELVVWMSDECKESMDDDGVFKFWEDHPNHGTWEVLMIHPKAARVAN